MARQYWSVILKDFIKSHGLFVGFKFYIKDKWYRLWLH